MGSQYSSSWELPNFLMFKLLGISAKAKNFILPRKATSWCERTSKFTVRTVNKCTSLRLYYSQRLQCQTHNFVQYKIISFVPVAPYPDLHKNHGSGSWTQGFIKYYKRPKNLFTHETLPLL